MSFYGQTHNRKWSLHLFRTEVNKLERLTRPTITGAMTMTPTAAMEVLLGLPPLHVMIEVEAQARIYRVMYHQQLRPKSTNFGHSKKYQDVVQEPILQTGYDRMLMRQVYHKTITVQFPDKCECHDVLVKTTKWAWSGIQMAPRPIKALVLGCTDGDQEGSIPSVLGYTPQYSKLQYTPLRLV